MNRRVQVGLAIGVASVGLLWIVLGDLGNNLVYYWTPTELVAAAGAAQGATIRLGGLVEPGSLKPEGTTLHFTVTDGANTVLVTTDQIPPQMFREGIGVVVEGTVDASGRFVSRRMMIKHDNEYRAPKEGEKPTEAAMFGTLDED